MGRQTRQARRAQERRANAQGKSAAKKSGQVWSAVAGAAIVLIAALFFIVHAATGAGTTPTATVAPKVAVDNITCNPGGEVVTYHQHAALRLYNKGKESPIPALIGFNVDHDCLFWVHTHEPSYDIIHEEAPYKIVPKLSTFFKIWGAPLTPTQIGPIKVTAGESVRTYINGKIYNGPLTSIVLPRHQDVVIEVGPPFFQPTKFDFAKYNV